MSNCRLRINEFLVRRGDLPKLENIKVPWGYFTGPFDNVELHMLSDSFQDNFSAVTFQRARETIPTSELKKRASVWIGENARGANESNDCPKTGIKGGSIRRTAEERNYSGPYCNC